MNQFDKIQLNKLYTIKNSTLSSNLAKNSFKTLLKEYEAKSTLVSSCIIAFIFVFPSVFINQMNLEYYWQLTLIAANVLLNMVLANTTALKLFKWRKIQKGILSNNLNVLVDRRVSLAANVTAVGISILVGSITILINTSFISLYLIGALYIMLILLLEKIIKFLSLYRYVVVNASFILQNVEKELLSRREIINEAR